MRIYTVFWKFRLLQIIFKWWILKIYIIDIIPNSVVRRISPSSWVIFFWSKYHFIIRVRYKRDDYLRNYIELPTLFKYTSHAYMNIYVIFFFHLIITLYYYYCVVFRLEKYDNIDGCNRGSVILVNGIIIINV